MAFRHAYSEASDAAGKVEVVGRVVMTTTKAVLLDDGASRQWLPKRFVKISEPDRAGHVEVLMPEWLAKDKRYI